MASPRLTVSNYYFPIGAKINDEHIRQLYGMKTKKWDHKDFKKAKSELQSARTNARTWGKQKLESNIIYSIRQQNVNVRTFMELCEEFKKDGSTDFGARLWNTSYTTFDKQNNWELGMENEYMITNYLSYDKTENVGKKTKG